MHTARLWETDRKAEPGAELLCLVDAIGQSLLSQATDITLIFRGRVAICGRVCPPVAKTFKIRGKCSSGRANEGRASQF